MYVGDTFKDPVFGSSVSKMPESQMDSEAVKLLQNAMKYANDRSLNINFGFDISTVQSNPEVQLSTLPKSAQLRNFGGRLLANPDTPEGYEFFKSQIAGLLEDYPFLTHITPWVRYMKYPTGGVYIAVKNMPETWISEYNNILKKIQVFKEIRRLIAFSISGKYWRHTQEHLKNMDVKILN